MKKILSFLVVILFLSTLLFSGCIETEIYQGKLGWGIKEQNDQLMLNESILGENLYIQDGKINSIDNIGGGDGYRSDNSIITVVEQMTHSSIDFSNRQITSSFDNITTKIRCEDGTIWNPTNTNLITAINYVRNTNKTLEIPSNFFEISENISIKNCKIIGMGSARLDQNIVENYGYTRINLTNNNTINIYEGGYLQGVHIHCPTTHGSTAVHIWGGAFDDAGLYSNNRHWGQLNLLYDVAIEKGQRSNGTGLNISADETDGVTHNFVALCTFSSINIYGFEYGMILYSYEEGLGKQSFVNGNIFLNVLFQNNGHMLTLKGNDNGAVDGNSFYGIQYQPNSNCKTGITLINASRNNFDGVFLWDWHMATDYAVIIDSNSDYNRFCGYYANYSNLGNYNTLERLHTSRVIGPETTFSKKITMDNASIQIEKYDSPKIILYEEDDGHYYRFGADDGFYYFDLDQNDNGNFYEGYNRTLEIHHGYIKVDSILKLEPISEPTNPENNTIWINATSSKPNYYDGSNVYEFNMTLLH